MHFDEEGHLLVAPNEVEAMIGLADRGRLVNNVLLPGTPAAIPTHEQHCRLLHHFANNLGIHPNSLVFRGSTKLGFSIAPKLEKVWMEFGPLSDLDLAIVDATFFQLVDYEVGRWEWNADNRGSMFRNDRRRREYNFRIFHKGKFDCFRFFDLPKIPILGRLYECLSEAPVEACCGAKRSISAFVFRDWWGVWKRYDYDLSRLSNGLRLTENPLPHGEDVPRPYAEAIAPGSEEFDE
jgi:hypothetical protein